MKCTSYGEFVNTRLINWNQAGLPVAPRSFLEPQLQDPFNALVVLVRKANKSYLVVHVFGIVRDADVQDNSRLLFKPALLPLALGDHTQLDGLTASLPP